MSPIEERAYIQRRNDLIAADLLKGQRRADVARKWMVERRIINAVARQLGLAPDQRRYYYRGDQSEA
jgi:hypothetical protein